MIPSHQRFTRSWVSSRLLGCLVLLWLLPVESGCRSVSRKQPLYPYTYGEGADMPPPRTLGDQARQSFRPPAVTPRSTPRTGSVNEPALNSPRTEIEGGAVQSPDAGVDEPIRMP